MNFLLRHDDPFINTKTIHINVKQLGLKKIVYVRRGK